MCTYLSDYLYVFKNKTKSNFGKVRHYVKGIVLSDLNNIERISEVLEAKYHEMQHFISDSKWDPHALIDQVAQDVSKTIPRQTLTGLLIGKCMGNKSVGVGINIVTILERQLIHK